MTRIHTPHIHKARAARISASQHLFLLQSCYGSRVRVCVVPQVEEMQALQNRNGELENKIRELKQNVDTANEEVRE